MNVRMAIKDLELIDKAVESGEALNRADFIRAAVREKVNSLKLASQCPA